jgi:hypothetical protein
MTAPQLIEQLDARLAEARALSSLWKASGLPGMNDGQISVWLDLHPFQRMVHAIKRTASKNSRLDGSMTLDHAVRYCSKVANDEKTALVESAR